MSNQAIKNFDVRKITLLGSLTAITVVLQILAIVVRPFLPAFTLTLVLVPIVIGAALCGVKAGGWLGFAFGAAVLLSGDAAVFFTFSPLATVLVVLLKGILCGLAAGVVYKLFEDKNKTLAVIAAAVICPIVNTGVFVIGAYTFFLPLVTQWAGGAANVTSFIFLGMIGINFLVEMAINIVLAPAIVRLVQIGKSNK